MGCPAYLAHLDKKVPLLFYADKTSLILYHAKFGMLKERDVHPGSQTLFGDTPRGVKRQ